MSEGELDSCVFERFTILAQHVYIIVTLEPSEEGLIELYTVVVVLKVEVLLVGFGFHSVTADVLDLTFKVNLH